MGITRAINRMDVTDPRTGVWFARGNPGGLRVVRSGRIGVSRDLRRPLRFYAADSPWVSGPRGSSI